MLDDPTASNPLVDRFLEMNSAINRWISDTTPERVAVLSVFGVLGALLIGWRDLESDPVKRRSVTASYGMAWVVVEFGFNGGDFILLPVARFLAGWPLRALNWFTDPLRFGVVWIAWRRIARYRQPQHVPGVVGAT